MQRDKPSSSANSTWSLNSHWWCCQPIANWGRIVDEPNRCDMYTWDHTCFLPKTTRRNPIIVWTTVNMNSDTEFPTRAAHLPITGWLCSWFPKKFATYNPVKQSDKLLIVHTSEAASGNTGISGITWITSEYRKIQSFCRQNSKKNVRVRVSIRFTCDSYVFAYVVYCILRYSDVIHTYIHHVHFRR